MSKNICAPNSAYDYTCFSTNALKRIAGKLNTKESKTNKKITVRKVGGKVDKKKLVNDISKKLNCNSNLDFCVLKQEDKFPQEVREAFVPKSKVANSDDWLSSTDIKKVMDQYMKKYKDFYFIGPVPIDFEMFYDELANVNMKSLSRKGKRIAIIFNTDPSYKSGEHWISLFIDLKNKSICFFDSVGTAPPKEVMKLIKKVIDNAKKVGIDLKLIINKNEHQKKNTECGIYSLYHIISRLQGKSCSFIYNNIMTDGEVSKFRKKYFRDCM